MRLNWRLIDSNYYCIENEVNPSPVWSEMSLKSSHIRGEPIKSTYPMRLELLTADEDQCHAHANKQDADPAPARNTLTQKNLAPERAGRIT